MNSGVLFLFLPLVFKGCVSGEGAEDCCPQIFLQSSGNLGETQSAVLGIYTITNQKLANTPHPVYAKLEEQGRHHVYFRVNKYGPQGWIVGGELLEDSFYITTGQTQPSCPEGIVGGSSGGNQTDVDIKFSIECHTDQVKIPCCQTVNVTANGIVQRNQGGSLGVFKQSGDLNGRPLYKGGHMAGFLFYRKTGSGPDGWVISTSTDPNFLMVTTRQKEYCPDVITAGFDRDEEMDNSLSIACVANEEEDYYQDPGLSALPLNRTTDQPTKDMVSANSGVLSMNSIRILSLLYLWVIHQ